MSDGLNVGQDFESAKKAMLFWHNKWAELDEKMEALKKESVSVDPQDDFTCPVEWKEYHGHDGTKVLCPYSLDKRINWWELKGMKGTLTFREET